MLYYATSGHYWTGRLSVKLNQEDLLLITITLVHAVAAAKLLLATKAVAAAHAACPPAAEAALLLETLAAHPATGQ